MQKKRLSIALSLFTILTFEVSQAPSSYAAYLQTRAYDYTNPIYQSGINDTFIYDTNDSIITTKTGIERNIPQVSGRYDRSYYPIPLENRVPSQEIFELIKAENKELMDQVEVAIAEGTLTKHIAADGQFYGSISDDVLGVEKKAYINTSAKGSHSLAAYVPAGEIATIKLSDEAMKYAEKGQLKIIVGQHDTNAEEYYYNSNDENRMPYLGKVFSITEQETKVGTPFGGMVYLEVGSNVPSGLNLEVEISGVVDAPYYDLGRTTEEEWQAAQSAPGLMAEIRTPYLRFMIPSAFIRDVEGITQAVQFWDNATALSSHVMGQENRNSPMTLIFDQYITAGVAYASVGAWKCNLPPSWATTALDYNTLMTSGSWGLIHEINHHYQSRYSGYRDNWGLGDEFSEITNNTLNTISYILYSNIAATRGEEGTDDWNKVADPYSSLKQQMYESVQYYPGTPNYGNFMYSTFAHEIGPMTLANVIKSTYDGATFNGVYVPAFDYKAESDQQISYPNNDRYDDFAYRICLAAGRDYTWYIVNELKWPLKDETIQKIKALGYEEHIPVQSVYAMGEVGCETGRPFTIPVTGYVFDFDKSLVSPGKVTVIDVSEPKYGTLTKRDDGKYEYQVTTPIPDDAYETMTLTVRVEAGGIVQETKLNCTFVFNYNGTRVEQYAITKWDIFDALEDIAQKDPYAITSSKGMKIDTDYGNNLARSQGYFKVEESGMYEFQVFGDDNTAFYLEVDEATTLRSLTQDYSNTPQSAYDLDTSEHFEVYLEANKPYAYTLVANNKDGIGWADVQFRSTTPNSPWQEIKNVYSDLEYIGKVTNDNFIPAVPEYVRPHILAGSDETILKDIKVISHPLGVIPTDDPNSWGEGDPENIVDGDMSTYFHSSHTDGNRTPFPHEYVFDLNEIKCFNQLDIFTRTSGDTVGVIGDYEIYVADELEGDQTQWRKVAEDITRYKNSQASKDLSISLAPTEARYIKVKALNNRDDYNLTILAEVKVSNKTTVNQLIAQDSSYIQYKGTWVKDVNGAFVNGGTYNSSDGSFSYAINGSETNIYVSQDVEVEVSIDGGPWTKYSLQGSLREPSVTFNMDSEGVHTIEVRTIGQQINLNMISTDGTFIKEDAPDRTQGPQITGIDNVEIGIGEVDNFDVLKDVVVIDDRDQNLIPIVIGEIKKPAPGTTETSVLTYQVMDSDGNVAVMEREITVTNQLPILEGTSITIQEGEEIELLTDSRLGLMATDYEDGDLVSKIKVIDLDGFNPKAPSVGEYTVTYEVLDSDGNQVTLTLNIEVIEKSHPIINGIENLTIMSGQTFDPMAGVSAIDSVSQEPLQVEVIGEIDLYQIGEQTLTYQITTLDGDSIEIQRTITVTYLSEEPTDLEVTRRFIPHNELQFQQLIEEIKQYDANATLIERKEEVDYFIYRIKIIATESINSVQNEYLIEIKVAKDINFEPELPEEKPEAPIEPGKPGEKPEVPSEPGKPEESPDAPVEPEQPEEKPEAPAYSIPEAIKPFIDLSLVEITKGDGTEQSPLVLQILDSTEVNSLKAMLESIKGYTLTVERKEQIANQTSITTYLITLKNEQEAYYFTIEVRESQNDIIDYLDSLIEEKPEVPGEPEQPEEKPEVPGEPGKPEEKPEVPGEPGKPEEKPEVPIEPDKPEESPDAPVEPEQPSYSIPEAIKPFIDLSLVEITEGDGTESSPLVLQILDSTEVNSLKSMLESIKGYTLTIERKEQMVKQTSIITYLITLKNEQEAYYFTFEVRESQNDIIDYLDSLIEDKPEAPSEPQQPEEKPEVPGEPVLPGEKPETPIVPEQPGKPEEKPGVPSEPEQPEEKPEAPGEPELPEEKPEAPSGPGKPEEKPSNSTDTEANKIVPETGQFTGVSLLSGIFMILAGLFPWKKRQ